MSELSDKAKAGLRGKLSLAEFQQVGDELFLAGLAGFDPLAVQGVQNAYPLTEKGREVARALRNPA